MTGSAEDRAHYCARAIRGCATDEQYTETVERIADAIIDAEQRGAREARAEVELLRAARTLLTQERDNARAEVGRLERIIYTYVDDDIADPEDEAAVKAIVQKLAALTPGTTP